MRRECLSLDDTEPPPKVHIITRNTPRALATTLRRAMSRRLQTAPPGLLDRYLERIIITQVIDMEDLLTFVCGLQSAGGPRIGTEAAPEQEPAQETPPKRAMVTPREGGGEEPPSKKLQPAKPVARAIAFARNGTPPPDGRCHKPHSGAVTVRAASPDPLAREDDSSPQVLDQVASAPTVPPEADPTAESRQAAAAAPPGIRQPPVAGLVVVHSMGTLIASEYAKHKGSERFRRNVARLAASLRRLARNPDDGHPLVLLLNETAAPRSAAYDGSHARLATHQHHHHHHHHHHHQQRPAYEDYFHPLVDVSLLCTLVGRVDGTAAAGVEAWTTTGGPRAQKGWSAWEVVVAKDAVGVWPARAEDTAAQASSGERMERALKSREARSGLVVMDRGHVCSVAREKDHLPL